MLCNIFLRETDLEIIDVSSIRASHKVGFYWNKEPILNSSHSVDSKVNHSEWTPSPHFASSYSLV